MISSKPTRTRQLLMSDVLITDCTARAFGDTLGGALAVFMTADFFDIEAGDLFAQQVLLNRVTISHCVVTSQARLASGGSAYFEGDWIANWGHPYPETSSALQVVIENSEFTNCSAISGGGSGADGGCITAGVAYALPAITPLTITNTNFSSCSARTTSATAPASGGALCVNALGHAVALSGVTITDSSAHSNGGTAAGGAINFYTDPSVASVSDDVDLEGTRPSDRARTTLVYQERPPDQSHLRGMTMVAVHISDCSAVVEPLATITNAKARGGCVSIGPMIGSWPDIEIRDSILTGCSALGNGRGSAGGGGLALEAARVSVFSTSIASCAALSQAGALSARSQGGEGRGGGVLVKQDGLLVLRDRTALTGNRASTHGGTIDNVGGGVSYALPAPAGRWAAASTCMVYRQSCPATVNGALEPACLATQDRCSELPDVNSVHAMVNGTTCQPLLSAQPCDWGSNPELLGQQVQAIQQGGFESDIPYVCAVGILGASHATDQMSSLCGGPTRAGTWQPNPGGTVELPCPPGYFCPVGTVNPLPCVAGTWSNASNLAHGCPSVDPGHFSSAGSTRQRPCNPGSVAPVGGLSECQACPPGSHQRSTGATQCAICPANSYCPEGTSHPLSCESGAGIPNAVTLEAGSSGSGDCRCKKGYYDDESLPGQIHCTICPSGVDCSESAGTTVSTLPIKVGYYRISRSSVDVRRCPDAATNCSDSPECVQSTSGCGGTAEARSNLSAATASRRRLRDNGAGSSNATDGCHEGLTGVFCRLCAPRDDTRSVYYTAATTSAIAHCTDCRESVRDSILVFFGYLALAAIVGLLLYCTYIACLSTSRKQQLDHAWQKFTPHNKLKILIGFCAWQPRSIE